MWPLHQDILPPLLTASLTASLTHSPSLPASLLSPQDPRDDVSGEHQVAEDMLDFLQEFFEGEGVSLPVLCCVLSCVLRVLHVYLFHMACIVFAQ